MHLRRVRFLRVEFCDDAHVEPPFVGRSSDHGLTGFGTFVRDRGPENEGTGND